MTSQILQEVENNMKQTISSFEEHLKKIRTGRANPSMLDSVKVEYYGDLMPLNQIAQVASPQPQQLTIKPYDKSTLGTIQSALHKSNLNLNPQVEADLIRITIPPLNEEIRKGEVKEMNKELEAFKIRIRNARRDGIDTAKKSDAFSEDSLKALEKQIQTITDKYISELETLAKQKEKDIMSI